MSSVSSQGSVAEINVTPLIDVLLVLLIIFMVIVPAVPRGMESSVPQPPRDTAAPTLGPVRLEIRVQGEGAMGLAYRVDGQAVDGAGLGDALRANLSMRPERSLLVAGDRGLSYDEVAQAIATARDAGAWPIGIEGKAGPTGQ